MATKEEEEMIRTIVRVATSTTLELLEQRAVEQRKQRLRNTKLLLKHYREFVKHVNSYIPDDAGSDEIENGELAIESIKKSKRRTYIIVQFIQRAMEMYRISCEQSGKPEQIRKYKIVYAMYVEEPQRKIEEIADCHKVENRTLYRDVNDAAKALSALIFGVDGVRLAY